MALFKPIRRISSELSAVEKRNGQFLIATDTGEAFVDISDSERLQLLGSGINVFTGSLLPPGDGFKDGDIFIQI